MQHFGPIGTYFELLGTNGTHSGLVGHIYSPIWTYLTQAVTFRTEVKKTATSLTRTTHHTNYASHLMDLSKQGPLLNLSIREVQDMT